MESVLIWRESWPGCMAVICALCVRKTTGQSLKCAFALQTVLMQLHEAAHFQEFLYPFPEDSVLIMHSDGLSTSWNLSSYPGLRSRHPAVIGGTLYRDAARQRDDALVIVAKESA